MEVTPPTLENPLTAAANEVRIICRDHQTTPRSFDAAALGRILAHINNINRSVVASTADHCNATKRLNDFAIIFDRLAKSCAPASPELSARLESVVNKLRAASEELRVCDAIPNWDDALPEDDESVAVQPVATTYAAGRSA